MESEKRGFDVVIVGFGTLGKPARPPQLNDAIEREGGAYEAGTIEYEAIVREAKLDRWSLLGTWALKTSVTTAEIHAIELSQHVIVWGYV